MTRIAAVAPVVPEYCYTQAEITAEVAPLLAKAPSHRAVLERVHANSRIDTRYTVLEELSFSADTESPLFFDRESGLLLSPGTKARSAGRVRGGSAVGRAPVHRHQVLARAGEGWPLRGVRTTRVVR